MKKYTPSFEEFTNESELNEAKKLWYIGERHNPQFKKPYYVAYGQLSKTEANKKEKTIYGQMWVTGYDSEKEFEDKIKELKSEGYSVRRR